MRTTDKRTRMLAAGLLLVYTAVAAANEPPVVIQVTASQRDDGSKIVDIYYQLDDPEGDPCIVELQASDDGGNTWTLPIVAVEGDVGGGVVPGGVKHVIWWSGVDLPNASGSNFRLRICAEDIPGQSGAMVLIPGGGFVMGDVRNEGHHDEQPAHWVWVSDFYMGDCEVTNAEYVLALNWALDRSNVVAVGADGVVYQDGAAGAAYCDTVLSSVYSRITWDGYAFAVELDYANHPVVCVSWHGAAAYANWLSVQENRTPCYDENTWECDFSANGYRLPTEAEWEKAARGGSVGGRFSWGGDGTIQHALANYDSNANDWYDTSPTRGYHPAFSGGSYPYTNPVDYFAPNAYGLFGMTGNAWEWCHDWYAEKYYQCADLEDPTGPVNGWYRVLRGGSWFNSAYSCRAANRYYYVPEYQHDTIGFRVVRSAP
jgi:sulfatase modifying factor 1